MNSSPKGLFELWVWVSENMVDIAPEQTCLCTITLIKNVNIILCDKRLQLVHDYYTHTLIASPIFIFLLRNFYMTMLFIMMICGYQETWFMQQHLIFLRTTGMYVIMFMDCHGVTTNETLQENNNKAGPFPVTDMKLWYLLCDC